MLFGSFASRLLPIPLATDGWRVAEDQAGACFPSCGALSPLCHDFDSLVNATLSRYGVSGMAIAVVDGDKTHNRGYGIAKFPDVPVTPETMFFTGSTTKAFTAAALSLLIDDQSKHPGLSWTTPINDLIPEDFVLMDDYSTRHVTLQDAASHRTGLPRHDLSARGGNQTSKGIARSLRFLPLTKPLRTTFQYCNLMFATLGYVVEVLSGQSLGDFFAERIWNPLNMTSTYLSIPDAVGSGKPFARGHEWLHDSQTFIEVEYADLTAEAGAGAVISTVLDYVKWARMMMRGGFPLSKAGRKALITPHMIVGNEEVDAMGLQMYGYGWQIEQYKGHDIIYHSGAVTGFGANILLIPDADWACIIMTNSLEGSLAVTDILTWHLVEERLQVPLSERSNRRQRWDVVEAIRQQVRNETLVRELIFPSSTVGNLSSSLPLEKYAGVYTHPGYGELGISYENGTLWNKVDRAVWGWKARLDHVSGDTFFVVAYNADGSEDPAYTVAEFRIDVRGQVAEMSVILEAEMGDERLWFARVDQASNNTGFANYEMIHQY